ncbi:unnamed protein product [Notodromas monacha]|uniref:PAN2-PAN3 deadenylation complex subunit PAN3 n=1 Tax=Notodromas monacha TaxID=399045 RepID=A0A7R9BSR6_9CRUS|nr:unnamed protein product [Notodromas monacha]CAG0921052.1 unnamed protein product [Notodromas monacha]
MLLTGGKGLGAHGHVDGLDFMNYPPQNGIPQESKLLTYLGGRGGIPEDGMSKILPSMAVDDKKSATQSPYLQRSMTPQSSLTHSVSTPSFASAYQRGFSIDGSLLRNGVDHASSFPPLPNVGTSAMSMNLPGSASVTSSGRFTPSPSMPGIMSPTRITPQHSPPNSRRRSPSRTTEASSLYHENVNGTTYFYTQPANGSVTGLEEDMSGVTLNGVHPPGNSRFGVTTNEVPGVILPDYHMFPGQPAHINLMQPKANTPSFFMPDELRAALLRQNQLRLARADPEVYPSIHFLHPSFIDLVHEVDKYHDLCPLEPLPSSPHHKSIVFGCVTSVYKATSSKSGEQFTLRRVHGYRLTSNMNMKTVQAWRDLQHSNIVQFREVFTTKTFGDNCEFWLGKPLVLVYDYHPGAETLQSRHFSGGMSSSTVSSGGSNPFIGASEGGMTAAGRSFGQQGKAPNLRQHSGLLPESLIWNYVIYISSALRTIHAAGLAFRSLHPSKILITHKSRVRLSCGGMADLISPAESASAIHAFQQEDLMALGKLILALACNTLMVLQSRESMHTSMDIVTRNYSVDLRNLITYLLATQRTKAVIDIMPMIGARFYTQLDSSTLRGDVIEAELAKEVENGRLFRLISKLCTIIERADLNMDMNWSETGDRYMLKLFRDYIFHQVTEEGQPWLDLSHVVYCLNRLEAGSNEKIALMSRDEQNILVVSYTELKHCMEQAWQEIEASATNPAEGGALPRPGPGRSDLAHTVPAQSANDADHSVGDPTGLGDPRLLQRAIGHVLDS